MMENRFTPSVNIIRDLNKSFEYIQTPNVERVFEQLDNNYAAGIHSFNIIGSFGTGKSSFLLALEKQLKGEKKFFNFSPKTLNGSQSTEVINIIGSYRSIEAVFIEKINPKNPVRDVLVELEVYYEKLRGKNKRLMIIVDEFGKFLEYAAANNPEKELYFVQLLCEFANDVNKDILFITTLHQNFQAYTVDLNVKQRMEWEKVKGRFKEIAFNEPVEQLLFLASRYLQKEKHNETPDGYCELMDSIINSNAFPAASHLDGDLTCNLLPLEILSAPVLTLALQKYGQNERSLFSFLKSNDLYGLEDYDRKINPYYNLSCTYDYLMHNFYIYLSSKYNPDYNQWAAIRNAQERAAASFENDWEDTAKLIKCIGLLNIFASKGAKIDHDFLSKYGHLSLGIKEPAKIIKSLQEKKIIRYQEFKNSFILYEGTDLDIDFALRKASSYLTLPQNIVPILNKYFQFPYILAKAVFYKNGTPRFFQIVFSNQPIKKTPKGLVDGFINLIFNESINPREIQNISKECNEAILYGAYRNPIEIKNIIWEIEKLDFVLKENMDDRVVYKELKLLLSHNTNELNQKILSILKMNTNNRALTWYFKGEKQSIANRRAFNELLSSICEQIYYDTPHYKNELINRRILSNSIHQARKYFLRHLTKNWQHEEFGFETESFPPQKTIYLSLLKNTRIHGRDEDGFVCFSGPQEESFKPLWNRCDAFLENAKNNRMPICDLIHILSEKPFKLKQGFLEFWIPIFLFIKRDSFALFFNDSYIPYLDDEILFAVTKNPDRYFIKTFQIEGIRLDLFNKYRKLLNKDAKDKLTNINFIDTIRPFLAFYSDLPEYSKKTRRLSPDALALRDAIATAKDPEKTFFEDFPNAFGYSITHLTDSERNLEEFFYKLKEGLLEIKKCFAQLLKRIELFLIKELNMESPGYQDYKKVLQNRYKTLRPHLLLHHQKSFISRLHSELDDSGAWLKSLAHSVLDKPVEMIEDSEEELIYKKLTWMFAELDNLCELSKLQVDRDKEEVVKIDITTLTEGMQTNLIRFPRNRIEQGQALKSKIEKNLSTDKYANIAALLSLLEEQLKNE
jgi:hypothetical protein